jgi:hypothetical protein
LLCKEKGGRAVFSKAVGLFGGIVAGGGEKTPVKISGAFTTQCFMIRSDG